MNTPSNAVPESPRLAGNRARGHVARLGPCTGRCGANCGRTVRSTSRRWPSPRVFLFGFLISMFGCRRSLRGIAGDPCNAAPSSSGQPYEFAADAAHGDRVSSSGSSTRLDALYGERRDRSILFWKSLPVSDLTTVLSKATIPLVVLPLLAFAITVVRNSSCCC